MWHTLSVKTFHFKGSFVKKTMYKSFAFHNRTEITLNFLTSDCCVANTKGKECGSVFSSRGSHADFPRASLNPLECLRRRLI